MYLAPIPTTGLMAPPTATPMAGPPSQTTSVNASLAQSFGHNSNVPQLFYAVDIYILISSLSIVICTLVVVVLISMRLSKCFDAWVLRRICCIVRDDDGNCVPRDLESACPPSPLPSRTSLLQPSTASTRPISTQSTQSAQPAQTSRLSRFSIRWPFWQSQAPSGDSSRAENQLVVKGLAEAYGLKTISPSRLDKPLPPLPSPCATPSATLTTVKAAQVRSMKPQIVHISTRNPPSLPRVRSISPLGPLCPSDDRTSLVSLVASVSDAGGV